MVSPIEMESSESRELLKDSTTTADEEGGGDIDVEPYILSRGPHSDHRGVG